MKEREALQKIANKNNQPLATTINGLRTQLRFVLNIATEALSNYKEGSEGKTDKGWVALFSNEEEWIEYLKWRNKPIEPKPINKLNPPHIQEVIDGIRKVSEEIKGDKEKALQFLKDAGIEPKEEPLQFLANQAQELKMGYEPTEEVSQGEYDNIQAGNGDVQPKEGKEEVKPVMGVELKQDGVSFEKFSLLPESSNPIATDRTT